MFLFSVLLQVQSATPTELYTQHAHTHRIVLHTITHTSYLLEMLALGVCVCVYTYIVHTHLKLCVKPHPPYSRTHTHTQRLQSVKRVSKVSKLLPYMQETVTTTPGHDRWSGHCASIQHTNTPTHKTKGTSNEIRNSAHVYYTTVCAYMSLVLIFNVAGMFRWL